MNTAELQEFCNFVQGGRHKLSGKDFVEHGFPAFGAGGINGYLPEAEFDRDAVVLSSIGARCGKCFLAEGTWSSLANTQIIFPDLKRADIRFLWYQINDEERWPRRGLAQPFIRPSDVKSHRVYFPPLGEQRRIAAILDKADALRRKRRCALDLTLSARDHAFASAINMRNGSKTRKLGDALKFLTTGGRNWSAYYARSGKRFLRSLDVQMNKVAEVDAVYVRAPENAEAKRAQTRKGDVLLTVTGSRIGRVAALPDELDGAYVSQHVAILRPDQKQVGSTFLSMYLSSPAGQQQIAKWQYGQTKPGLNFEQIKMFEIPDISIGRQASIEVAMSSFNLLWDRQHEQIGALEALFASLQHRAFSGQL